MGNSNEPVDNAAERNSFLTSEDIASLEAAADEVRSTIYPERTLHFAGDGVSAVREMRVVSGKIQVDRGTADTREKKKLIGGLPKEINGFPVVVKDVVSICMFCSFRAKNRREMQRHRCDD